jgi:hypothetical protein
MKPTRKVAYNGFGLIALSIMFLLLYGYFNIVGAHLKPGTANLVNSTSPGLTDSSTVGALGGFHLLEAIDCSDEQTYYRVAIQTRLNRSTVIDQAIAIPLTKVEQVASTELLWWDGKYRDTKSLGEYRLQISPKDTGTVDKTNSQEVTVFQGSKNLVINQPPITNIKLSDAPDGSAVQVIVGLSAKARFRVSALPTGTIYIDILK